MPNVNKSALVPFSAEQMYKLVEDVNSYHKFLPWCSASEEIKRDNDVIVASVTIAKGGVNKKFTTRNLLQKNKMIEISLVDGPFKHLHGFWRFDELKADACKVSLDLEYEFSSKLLGMVVGPVFNQVANTMVDSFVEEAKSVYE
ncbi:MAG TPA: type II toxin-antitoxin system RatA family toxin [Leucothrix mucor]|nr:type II toxin-antitoxin system RatA family toxin [Leucothrix mucor]